jgi:hypothetical protein
MKTNGGVDITNPVEETILLLTKTAFQEYQ